MLTSFLTSRPHCQSYVAYETLIAVHHFVKKPSHLIFLLHKVLLYTPNNKKKMEKKENPACEEVTAAVQPDPHLPPADPAAGQPDRLAPASQPPASTASPIAPSPPLASSGSPSAAAQPAGAGHEEPPLQQRAAMDRPRCTGARPADATRRRPPSAGGLLGWSVPGSARGRPRRRCFEPACAAAALSLPAPPLLCARLRQPQTAELARPSPCRSSPAPVLLGARPSPEAEEDLYLEGE
jgi:hypothetical protein